MLQMGKMYLLRSSDSGACYGTRLALELALVDDQ